VSLGKNTEKLKFKLSPGQTNDSMVPTRNAFQVDAIAGKSVIGPVKETGSDQSLFFTIAVGNATSGSVTLLSKLIRSVF